MAEPPAYLTASPFVLALLGIVALVAACADSSSRSSDVNEAVAQLRSPEPAERYEAVVRLGMLPPSEARRAGLAGAVRDRDDAVRLMAAIVVVGDGPTEHAGWLRAHRAAAPSSRASPAAEVASPPARTPNPSPSEDLSLVEDLVYLDPWFAGTLLPGALVAAQDPDERVRTLGHRAIKHMKPRESLDGATGDEGRAAK